MLFEFENPGDLWCAVQAISFTDFGGTVLIDFNKLTMWVDIADKKEVKYILKANNVDFSY